MSETDNAFGSSSAIVIATCLACLTPSIDFKGTPLNRAIHGSENSWHPGQGDYPPTVELLLRAGAKPPTEANGSPAVRAVLTAMQAEVRGDRSPPP